MGRVFYLIPCLVLFALAMQLGCNSDRPPLGYVTGKVTMDGEPFSGVIVTFLPDNGRPGVSTTDAQGKYNVEYRAGVKGTKVGPTSVIFMPPTGGEMSHSIPSKYQTGTEFKIEVKQGRNEFDFPLESDAKASKVQTQKGIVVD